MQNRRETLKHSAIVAGLLATTGFFPQHALAFNQSAFDSKTLDQAYKALGIAAPTESADIVLTAPDIAENGAVVPFVGATTLAGVKKMMFLVEKNPSVLIAQFNVTDSVEPNFSIRSKMGETSNVYAVAVMADGKTLFAKKEVKVTAGGCGG